MSFLFDIKEKKPNSKTLPNKKPSRKEENLADTHSEIKKKIDTLIAKREKVGKSEKQNLASQEKKDDSMEEIVEIRGSLKKKRVMSHLKSENASDGLNSKEEMFPFLIKYSPIGLCIMRCLPIIAINSNKLKYPFRKA